MQNFFNGTPTLVGLGVAYNGFNLLRNESKRKGSVKDFEEIYKRLKSKKENDECILNSLSAYMEKYHPSIRPYEKVTPEDAACNEFYQKWGQISPVFYLGKFDAKDIAARSKQSELIFAKYLEDLKKGVQTTAADNKKKGLLLSGVGASLLVLQSIEWYLGYYK